MSYVYDIENSLQLLEYLIFYHLFDQFPTLFMLLFPVNWYIQYKYICTYTYIYICIYKCINMYIYIYICINVFMHLLTIVHLIFTGKSRTSRDKSGFARDTDTSRARTIAWAASSWVSGSRSQTLPGNYGWWYTIYYSCYGWMGYGELGYFHLVN